MNSLYSKSRCVVQGWSHGQGALKLRRLPGHLRWTQSFSRQDFFSFFFQRGQTVRDIITQVWACVRSTFFTENMTKNRSWMRLIGIWFNAKLSRLGWRVWPGGRGGNSRLVHGWEAPTSSPYCSLLCVLALGIVELTVHARALVCGTFKLEDVALA